MLSDFRKYDYLGSPEIYYSIFKRIESISNCDTKIVLSSFFNQIIDGQSNFISCIEFAIEINLISVNDDYLILNDVLKGNLNSLPQMKNHFITTLINYLRDQNDFGLIFNSKHLSYDIVYKKVQISNNAFQLRHSNIKQLFLDFGIIHNHPNLDFNSFLLDNKHIRLFDNVILPEIKRRGIGIDEFKKIMERNQINGENAEQFVMEFEAKRLGISKDKVTQISVYQTNAGYDILSFNSPSDTEFNRFIEVKSYQGNAPNFFWTKNEINTAKILREKYWIYLVASNRIHIYTYQPEMIRDPYNEVFENDTWSKDVDKFRIYK